MTRRKPADGGSRNNGNDKNAATGTDKGHPEWPITETLLAAGGDLGMYGKILRVVKNDKELYDRVQYGADHQRKRILQQTRDKIAAGTKSEKDKAKDKAKAGNKTP